MSVRTTVDFRTCQQCKRTLPLDRFYASGRGNGRRTTCARCINEALGRERRARGASVRHNRINVRGHVWCNRCEKYLPPENFKIHPSRPHTFWSYCKPCVIELDRERYRRKVSTMEGALKDLEARQRRKHQQRKAQVRDRKEFVTFGLDQIRQRGFTRAEVGRLLDISPVTLGKWSDPKDKTQVLEAGERRIEVVLMAVSGLPRTGYVNGRRLPHPEYQRVYATTRDEVESIYLRNAWTKKNGERGRGR